MLVVMAAISYGAILAISALLMDGAGDGTNVLAGLFSAPISLLIWLLDAVGIPLGVLICLIGIPLLWIAGGVLAASSDNTKKRVYLAVFLVIHYVSAILVLQTELYGDWKKFHEQWGFAGSKLVMLISLGVYLLGQIWLWLQLLRSFSSKGSQEQIASSQRRGS